MKTVNIKLKGNIIAAHGNGFYRVSSDKIPNDVICTLAGKMSKGFNKPDVGDFIEFEVSHIDMTKGRIIRKW